jgi:anthranilate phosphoribosyltransferase
MMSEHPFAQYVRILGKGPRLSRSLTLEETHAAVAMLLRGEAEPVQVGAFLCLMRARTETPAEVAGFALAIRDVLPRPSHAVAVDVDWPSYAGKKRQLPLFILAALLLAQNGLSVAMHGTEGHTAGRLYTREALAALGLPAAGSLAEAADQLGRRRFTYLPVEVLHPQLLTLLQLKAVLGLRSPLNTAVRHLNPLDARASIISVFHPNYRTVHRDAARLMGLRRMTCFKGEGGEVERRPEKPCPTVGLLDGTDLEEEWPVLLTGGPIPETSLDPARLAALWRGDTADPYAETVVAATAAVALRLTGRAATATEADNLARRLWMERDRNRLAA